MVTWLEMIASRAESDAPAVVTEQGSWSGRELMARAASGAEFLDAIGATVGSPVVALLTSTPLAFALTIGAAATDRPLAPLGPKLTRSELAPCIEALPGDVIVVEASSERLGTELAALTGRRVAVLPDLPPSDRALSYAAIGPDRPAAILHTSGTTGLPKAVAYTQGRLATRVRVNSELVMLGPDAVYATASPFHHIAGLGMLFVALGSGAALMSLPKFDLDAWRGLGRRGVTHALVVPTMIEMLLEADALALPGLRVLQYGASPIRPETLAQAMAALPGVKFVNLFGQTEGSPISCLGPADHVRAAGHPELLASVGRAAPGVEIVIDRPGPDGVGEIHARAEHLFRTDPDGWMRTGDLGRLDDEGYLFLSGRKGDKIIRGGENVYPIEVENVLAGHPAVAEVCVYGLPDRAFGEAVAASVVLALGASIPTWDDLRAFAREHLAGFKVPTLWETRNELPRNPTGKVVRRELIRTHTE